MLSKRNKDCKNFICLNFEVCKNTAPFDFCQKCPHDEKCTGKYYEDRIRCFNVNDPCSPCSIYGLCMLCERYKYCTLDDKISYFDGRFNGLTPVEDYEVEIL